MARRDHGTPWQLLEMKQVNKHDDEENENSIRHYKPI